MIKWLAYIINIVWIKKNIPDDWRRGIILPFWKNKGNKEVCSNHRGITLLSIAGKLFAMILLERIRPTFHNHCLSEQAGFTAGRSTTEHIFAIRQIIEKSKEFNKSTYIAFIDFKAAFDSVSRDSLWKILQIWGVPQELSVLVRQLGGGRAVAQWIERATDNRVVARSNSTETAWKLWQFPLPHFASVFRKRH